MVSFRFGQFEIETDMNAYIVHVIGTYKTGKNKGDEYRSDARYYSTLDGLKAGLADLVTKSSDAGSLKELFNKYKDTLNELEMLVDDQDKEA